MYFFGDAVEMEAGQAEIIDLVDLGVLLEELGDRLAILADEVHFRAQSPQVVEGEDGVDRGGGRPVVAVGQELDVLGVAFLEQRVVVLDLGRDRLAADESAADRPARRR